MKTGPPDLAFCLSPAQPEPALRGAQEGAAGSAPHDQEQWLLLPALRPSTAVAFLGLCFCSSWCETFLCFFFPFLFIFSSSY